METTWQAAAQAKKQGATGLIIRCEQVRWTSRGSFGSLVRSFLGIRIQYLGISLEYHLYQYLWSINVYEYGYQCLLIWSNIYGIWFMFSSCLDFMMPWSFTALHALCQQNSRHQALSVEKLAACLELRVSVNGNEESCLLCDELYCNNVLTMYRFCSMISIYFKTAIWCVYRIFFWQWTCRDPVMSLYRVMLHVCLNKHRPCIMIIYIISYHIMPYHIVLYHIIPGCIFLSIILYCII